MMTDDYCIPLRSRAGDIIAWTMTDRAYRSLVDRFNWFFDGMYAATKHEGRNLRLHKLIAGTPPPGLEIDHENRNKLDNRRHNLRFLTHAANCRNVPSQGGSSQYRGVVWDKERSRWRAQVKFDGRTRVLGRFHDEQAAAAAVVAFWESV